MIKLQIQGGAVIHSISPVQEIPSKNGGAPFQKRELILDDSWIDNNGSTHPNYVCVEFTGDRMPLLDNFQPGQRVSVDARVTGRVFNDRIFMSVRGFGIYAYQPPQQVYSDGGYTQHGNPPQQQAYPQQGNPQQSSYPSQPSYPAQPAPQPSAPPQATPARPVYQRPAQQPAYQQFPTGQSDLSVGNLPFSSNA